MLAQISLPRGTTMRRAVCTLGASTFYELPSSKCEQVLLKNYLKNNGKIIGKSTGMQVVRNKTTYFINDTHRRRFYVKKG